MWATGITLQAALRQCSILPFLFPSSIGILFIISKLGLQRLYTGLKSLAFSFASSSVLKEKLFLLKEMSQDIGEGVGHTPNLVDLMPKLGLPSWVEMEAARSVKEWQDKTNIQNEWAHSLHRLKGRWIRLHKILLASQWIHFIEPLLALPCNTKGLCPVNGWNSYLTSIGS